ncbi:MAG: anti-sigma regulatory factor [Gemmatimonadota bacterium]|nr:anti-sigma regulatory factor [Gemmatimonadota bacterium]MDH5759138.1 anti-sigma regulatory factor [Gemmatimonadota bacterium]
MTIRENTDVTLTMVNARMAALEMGFDDPSSRQIATAVAELARNILKYAGEGSVIVKEIRRGKAIGLEVTATDRGPGIEDVEAAMKDGFSSSGTLGLGLPGVRRMMDEVEIDTRRGDGTTIVARKWC